MTFATLFSSPRLSKMQLSSRDLSINEGIFDGIKIVGKLAFNDDLRP